MSFHFRCDDVSKCSCETIMEEKCEPVIEKQCTTTEEDRCITEIENGTCKYNAQLINRIEQAMPGVKIERGRKKKRK